ncbi:MAG: extracellular solute-binding protein [Anaerolineae bacterium]|nr:extracellular solute-binding protein [Anaerolineae bacterium]MCB0248951.1 extracellular solute-binding protein [Anaerolineae bacterium]
MSTKSIKILLALAVVTAMMLSACGGAATPAPAEPAAATATPIVEAAAPTDAPVAEATEAPAAEEPTAAPAAEEPTEAPAEEAMTPEVDPTGQNITFWHVWGTGGPSEAMQAIVDDFNANNDWGITVTALDQGQYNDLEDALNAAIQSGDVPDLVTGYTNAMANWYAVDSIVDLTPYVNDPALGLTADEQSTFFQGSLDGGKAADGSLFAFPISQSENVLFYNSGWAKELGFENAPTNYEEFKAQACAAAEANANDDNPDNDGTGGLVLFAGASNLASFVFANGGNMLNAAGDGYDFTDQTVVDAVTFLKDLWDSGCAFATESYPNPEFATRKALFTMSSTAGLPYQIAAFDAEDAIKDDWTIAPFPGKDGGQSVDLFGQYVAMANTNPERMMATWVFMKYLTSPEVQAKWIEGSAYYPTRSDTLPLIEAYGADNQIWSYGLSFLDSGKAEPAWASWTTVRRDVGDTLNAIIQGTPDDIPSMLEDLNAKAVEAIQETM